MQQDNIGTKHPAPLVLNGLSQFLQRFTVMLSIHRLSSGQEVNKENVLFVPEHRANHFLCQRSLLEFYLAERSTVTLMH